MNSDRVTELGRLDLEVDDLTLWERFATEVLGLEAHRPSSADPLWLRMDENHHRLALQQGARNDLTRVAWKVADERALEAVAARLASLGFAVERHSTAEAHDRGVTGLVTTSDPDGVTTDIYHGDPEGHARPFQSPRGIAGFVTGDLGLGHIVLNVEDQEASRRFYCDGLGLRISDFIDLDLGEGATLTPVFLHCGPRHHSLALVQIEAPKHLHHIMLEVSSLDDVGTTHDLCVDHGVPIVSSLGRHTNDHMTSFYLQTPAGFQIEYGYGGRLIDDRTWQVHTYNAASTWGHRAPATPAAI